MVYGLALSLSLLTLVAPPNLESLPKVGQVQADFVPAGWVLESVHEGDLNRDGEPDLVLVLVHETQQTPADENKLGERGLVVLARNKGKFRLLGWNKGILLCKDCGGMRGDGAPEVSIEKGVLIISNTWGSYDTSFELFRFWVDKKTGRLVLIGEDVEEHSETGAYERSSSNFLTGKGIEEKSADGDEEHAVRRTFNAGKRLTPIEDLKQ